MFVSIVGGGISIASEEPSRVAVDAQGAVHIPAFTMPFSPLASKEALKSFIDSYVLDSSLQGNSSDLSGKDIGEQRRSYDERYPIPAIQRLRTLFRVTIKPETIGGVQTDIVMPVGGTSVENRDRVLINLHGGSFIFGGRYGGQAESIPIAGLGMFKVVTVDYAMAPEKKFPAASEDVAKVYRELLKHYRSESIGIYGCSAGSLITAEAVAWFQTHGLPRPGAVGLLCMGAMSNVEGDSAYIGAVLSGVNAPTVSEHGAELSPYFAGGDYRDPLESPAYSATVLAKFPPTILITGTRDTGMTGVVYTHTQLVKAGADAELYVWEGMRHGFIFYDDNMAPEARDAWQVMVKFFGSRLGHGHK